MRLHWDFRTSSVKDQTANGNDGVFTAGPVWSNSVDGKALLWNGLVGFIQVAPDATTGNVFDGGGTFAAWVKPRSDGENDAGNITNKSQWILLTNDEAAGVCDLFWQYEFSGASGQWGTTARELTLNEWNFVTVTYDADAVANNPSLYVNGVLVANTEAQAPVGTRTTDTANSFNVGNNGGVENRTFDGWIREAMLFNTALTAAQVSTLYQESLQEANLNSVADKSRIPTPGAHPSEPGNLVGHWEMELRGTTVSDLSGNGNNGTIVAGNAVDTEGFFGRALDFDAVLGGVEVTDAVSIQDIFDSGGTMSSWIKPRTDGAGNNGRLAEKGGGRWFAVTQDSVAAGFGDIQWNFDFSGTNGGWETTTNGIAYGTWNHVAITYDSDAVANDPIMYVNGVSQAITENATPVGTRISDAGQNLFIGNRLDTARAFDGTIDEVRLYSDILTATEVLNLYTQGFARTDINTLADDMEVSDGNVASGFIENSGWERQTGTWQIDDSDDGGKQMTCVVAGLVSFKSPHAFGTWDFEVNHADASTTVVMIAASLAASQSAGSQNGYNIRTTSSESVELRRMTNGAGTNLMSTSASEITAGSWYKYRVTRSASGAFTVYQALVGSDLALMSAAGGGTNPATNTDHVTSSFLVFEGGAGDLLRNFRFYPTIQDPTVGPQP